MENVTLRVNYDNEDAVLLLKFPVLYRDLLREIRHTFQIDLSARLIIHYESNDQSIRRPLTGADDFDLMLQFQFHLKRANHILLFVSVDSSVPNLEVTNQRLIRIEQNLQRTQNKDQFIPEDLDPLSASLTSSVSDPLIGSYFIEENPSDASDSGDESNSIKLIKFIGKGGFGSVYTTIWSGQLVAVKLCQFDSDASDESTDILNEIDCFSALLHPNIVKYYGCGRDTQQIAIFMEFLPGGSMAQYIKHSGGFLGELEVQRFAVQILSGLDYLHQEGLVHRDIKGSNLLLDQLRTRVKLSDFGAAKRLTTLDRSRTDTLVGTTYWISPEVIRGAAAGRANDVWAFGITLIEMLTGEPPFKNMDPLAAMFRIASRPPSVNNFKHSRLEAVSYDLRKLLEAIFVEIADRITVKCIRMHSWAIKADFL